MKADWLKPHQDWLAVLGVGLVVFFAGAPLAHYGFERAGDRAKIIAEERADLSDASKRFDEDMQLAERPDGQMSVDNIERLLAQVDRLHVASALERQAGSARLSHFAYTLAPEKKSKLEVFDADPVVESDVTLAADAPLDTDLYSFIGRLEEVLPGRVHLRQFSLTRSADAPLSLANIHMEAEVEWLSNGTAKDKVEAP